MKKKISIFICSFLMVLSCTKSSVTDDEKLYSPEQIAGSYNAIVFTCSGPDDREVDILAAGGMISVELFNNFEVYGHVFIPDSTGAIISPTDVDFSGTYTLNVDSLHLKDTGTFLDNDMWGFFIDETKLQTPDWTGWRSTTKIVLEKQ